ncbi:phosphopantetheine adenylyltransferase [Faecalibacterium prausnitzii]|uniref:Phosphopantetheine adenylyltransferase n=1 Tax=Faecalibacterium prausnitzii TaxID=853 RepID=A0A291TDR1_9FIRM|nr:phosphopantetheine adenylyltransferase [Faecalibacterium prausnitzii]
MRCAAILQPSFAKVTTIYLIIINLYAVFKMKRYFICDIDNKKEWQHFKLKRCHSVGTA